MGGAGSTALGALIDGWGWIHHLNAQCLILHAIEKVLNVYRIRSLLIKFTFVVNIFMKVKDCFLIMLMLEEGNMYLQYYNKILRQYLENYSRLRFFIRDCSYNKNAFQ